jgi:cell wall-associated NlpC family hydrolase
MWRAGRDWLHIAVCLYGLAGVWGCSSSVPRFATRDASPAEAEYEEDEVRFAAKIREEEMREDDRKVDVEALSQRLASRPRSSQRYSNVTPAGMDRDKVLLEIVSMLGVPYRLGGNTQSGIDCSGFTLRVYTRAVERQIPRVARDQYGVGSGVTKSDLQFGDLVFFNTTGRSPSHVGIYIEDDLFAHASVSYGVTISSLESTYYRKRYVGARRVLD